MDYLGLTTTAQIRAVLTVSETDLPDEIIDGFGIEDDLGAALDLALKALDPVWTQIPLDSPNGRRIKLFAKYFCAATLAVTAQTFILKKIADGSNEGQRSDKDGFLWMAPALLNKANGYINLILDDLDLTPVAVAPFRLMTRVIPERDPITEPRAAI